jgi:hypothetical protein
LTTSQTGAGRRRSGVCDSASRHVVRAPQAEYTPRARVLRVRVSRSRSRPPGARGDWCFVRCVLGRRNRQPRWYQAVVVGGVGARAAVARGGDRRRGFVRCTTWHRAKPGLRCWYSRRCVPVGTIRPSQRPSLCPSVAAKRAPCETPDRGARISRQGVRGRQGDNVHDHCAAHEIRRARAEVRRRGGSVRRRAACKLGRGVGAAAAALDTGEGKGGGGFGACSTANGSRAR